MLFWSWARIWPSRGQRCGATAPSPSGLSPRSCCFCGRALPKLVLSCWDSPQVYASAYPLLSQVRGASLLGLQVCLSDFGTSPFLRRRVPRGGWFWWWGCWCTGPFLVAGRSRLLHFLPLGWSSLFLCVVCPWYCVVSYSQPWLPLPLLFYCTPPLSALHLDDTSFPSPGLAFRSWVFARWNFAPNPCTSPFPVQSSSHTFSRVGWRSWPALFRLAKT